MASDRVLCARLSRELGEDPAGSAAVTTGWLAIEHRGPWSSSAPSVDELGTTLDRLVAVDGVRTQLIRRADDPRLGGVAPATPPGETVTVLLAHAGVDPDERWLRRLEVGSLGELEGVLDPSLALSPSPPPVGQPVDHDVWLVCTHGRRDACCAVHGRPVVTALADAGVEVWETTHLGGHRFAATALLLPDGVSLGRLDTVDAGSVAHVAGSASELPGRLLRGRCAVPRPVQAAEVHARRLLDVASRDEILPIDWHEDGDGTTSVSLRGRAGQRWTATVHTRPVHEPRRVSDDADDTTPDEHTLVELVESP